MGESIDTLVKQHIARFTSEQESLCAKFLSANNLRPNDIELVSEHRGMSIVVYPRLKTHDKELQAYRDIAEKLADALEQVNRVRNALVFAETEEQINAMFCNLDDALEAYNSLKNGEKK